MVCREDNEPCHDKTCLGSYATLDSKQPVQ